MRRKGYKTLTLTVALAAVIVASGVLASQVPNSALIKTRIFNDCSSSVLFTTNNYPTLISIEDTILDCTGFANRHVWRLSDDSGVTESVFNNGDAFRLRAYLVLSGTSEGEGGLQVSPWWSQDVDGVFNVRSTDGEIAIFGGRLPFYSFTSNHSINYAKGDTICLEVVYLPNFLVDYSPGTIEYKVSYLGSDYTSGPLEFSEGNPAEDPPYGLWGILNDARVGGYVQCFLQLSNPNASFKAEWLDIEFEGLGFVPVKETTWGQIKNMMQ